MRKHLHLGLSFVDAHGSRHASFQLVNAAGEAIATADYKSADPICERVDFAGTVSRADMERFRGETWDMAGKDCVKSFGWSYPTSGNAQAFGHKEGCWTVSLGIEGKPMHAVRAFPASAFDSALSYAREIPFPWCAITLHVHPEYDSTKPAAEVLASLNTVTRLVIRPVEEVAAV
jgi:hypothetical protein